MARHLTKAELYTLLNKQPKAAEVYIKIKKKSHPVGWLGAFQSERGKVNEYITIDSAGVPPTVEELLELFRAIGYDLKKRRIWVKDDTHQPEPLKIIGIERYLNRITIQTEKYVPYIPTGHIPNLTWYKKENND